MYRIDEKEEPEPEPDGQKSELCAAVHEVSDMFLQLPVSVRRDICTLILDLIYHTPTAAGASPLILDKLAGYLAGSGLVAQKEHFNVVSVVHAARLLAQSKSAVILRSEAHTEKKPPKPSPASSMLSLIELLSSIVKKWEGIPSHS